MNTKIIMTTSAILLGLIGITLSFLPLEILKFLDLETSKTLQLLLQILGALYFSFALLNWMAKASHIGGIYNRPIAIANFAHFMVGGLALLKAVFSNPELPNTLLILTVFYVVFAVIFGAILFRHPIKNTK